MATEPPIKVAEVAAGRGAGWMFQAFDLFRRRPAAWLAMCAGWLAITFGLIVIPFLGGVIANFLQPVFFASFAIAAHKQVAGEPIAMNELFSGFRHNVKSLVNLGALLLIAEIAIFALMALLGLPMIPANEQGSFTMQEYVEALRGKEWILAFGFLLTIVIKGALWFAPPLIAFHGLPTGHAIRWSVYAALSNIGAMMAYGAVLLLLFIVGMIPWALGLLFVIPLMVISTYVGYRDVFESTAPPPAPLETPTP